MHPEIGQRGADQTHFPIDSSTSRSQHEWKSAQSEEEKGKERLGERKIDCKRNITIIVGSED